MGTEGSLPLSKNTATCPYPQLDESSSYLSQPIYLKHILIHTLSDLSH